MTQDIRLSNKAQKVTSSFNWPTVSILLIIFAIPAIPAVFILIFVALGLGETPIQSEFINPVYYQKPVVIFTHGIFGILFFVSAPFQFSTYLRQRYKQWHRMAGCITIISGIGIALSGIAMHHMLTPDVKGARYLSLLAFSAIMSLSFIVGFYYAWRKSFTNHQCWMYRAIAISATPISLLVIEISLNLLFGQLMAYELIHQFLFDYGRVFVVVLNLVFIECFISKTLLSSQNFAARYG
ncbi:DUF2306 domain-containing protein [Thalassotalea marina]|uniref:DUF2306 domain-containing protein n=1 Tax=Thalassotalea marina TaxID=1673741 RepID=A0A919BQE7_9GAMM|nr:DUF2306 domain-containing protein [Thalassotalea marina]GHG05216.1 hypothetical protein GCM10017161_38490 [Thalassotalea marina]